jgi:hypothetical protein
MLPKSDTNAGPLSMKTVAGSNADMEREEAEKAALAKTDGRKRSVHRVGRTEPISLKTFPHIKRLMLDMADAENKSFTEIIEDALTRRHKMLKGER